jgi:hypothetical protein
MAKNLMQKLSLLLRSHLPRPSTPPSVKEPPQAQNQPESTPMAAEPSLSEAIRQKQALLAKDSPDSETPKASSDERMSRLAKPEGPSQ